MQNIIKLTAAAMSYRANRAKKLRRKHYSPSLPRGQ